MPRSLVLRSVVRLMVAWGGLSLLAGCTHTVESRVVQAFANSLREHDLAQLRENASSEFEDKALPGEEAFDALKFLNLPEGKAKIVKVVDKADGTDAKTVVSKRVTVEFGDTKEARRQVLYHLTRDEKTGRWVVDDVYLNSADEKERKSVGARLAVLVSLREALAAWQSADRGRILTTATPEFARSLSDLPPEHLAHFAKRVTADIPRDSGARPNELLSEEFAELRVARPPDAEVVFKFRRDDSRWKVDDLAVESRRGGNDIASARQVSAAIGAALRFQAAYRASDKRTLEKVCTPHFFKGSLATADLSLVRLPVAARNLEEFDIKLDEGTATFIVAAGKEVLKVSLVQLKTQQVHAAPEFQVEDVTIYELENRREDKRLSALFTGHTVLSAFCAALAERDLKGLQDNATHDFNERVWKKLAETNVSNLPLGDLRPAKPLVVQTLFKGSVMHVLVEQGGSPLTYVLRDESGRMAVDDVLVPARIDELPPLTGLAGQLASRAGSQTQGAQKSLKSTFELMIPVLDFARGLKDSDMEVVRGCATRDFSRGAWNHFESTPEFDADPVACLHRPLRAVMASGDRAVVVLGDERHGAQVTLLKERGKYRIDDVTLVLGPPPAEPIGLKKAIRMQLAEGRK